MSFLDDGLRVSVNGINGLGKGSVFETRCSTTDTLIGLLRYVTAVTDCLFSKIDINTGFLTNLLKIAVICY